MNSHYLEVAARAAHRCEYCHAPEVIFNFPFEVEHVCPVSLDGADHFSNLALSCRPCNLFKTDQVRGRDDLTNSIVPLFHPRSDKWNEHFAINCETGSIVGLTPVGRATVNSLRMNAPSQMQARVQWTKLGLFS
jgi:hypothetical protein